MRLLVALAVHGIAALHAASQAAQVEAGLPLDPKIEKPETRAAIDQQIELHKVYYSWLVDALNDKSWKAPPDLDLGNLFAQVLSGQGPVGAVLGPLLQKLLAKI